MISKRRLFLSFVFFLFFDFNLTAQQSGIEFEEWHKDQVYSNAKMENKLIFVDVYAEWCRPCKVMEAKVFTDSTVATYFNQNFINVKWLEKEPEIKSYLDSLKIQSLPTYLFLHNSGEVVHKFEGLQSAKKVILEAEYARKEARSWKPISTLQDVYSTGKADYRDIKDLLNRRYATQGPQPQLLRDYLKVLPKSLTSLEANLILIAQHIGGIESDAFLLLKNKLNSFFEFTEVQQKAVLEGLARAKYNTFQKAVKEEDEALFNELIKAVFDTSYSQQAAMQEERQFRYDFAKLTENFKFFAIIAYAEAPLILDQDFAKLDAEKQQFIQSNPNVSAQEINAVLGSSQKAAAGQLHDFALGFLYMTDDKDHLQNALKWSASSISLDEKVEYWLTYAKLLHSLGRERDAKRALKKSKRMYKKLGGNTNQEIFSLEIDTE